MESQTEGKWQSFIAVIIYKLALQKGVVVTTKDVEEFLEKDLVLMTHGQVDFIEFRLVTEAEAKVLAEHDKTQSGTA